MKKFGLIGIPTLIFACSLNVLAQDVDEQTRRCNMEKNSLTNPSHQEGAECMKLRAMLGVPEAPRINNTTIVNQQQPSRQASPDCRERNGKIDCW